MRSSPPASPTDTLPARLLSGRNEPSVLEKEALFEAVLADVAANGSAAERPPPAVVRPGFGRQARWLWGSAAGLSLAAAAALLWLGPPGSAGELRAKGAVAEEGALELECLERGPRVGACLPGGTLAFRVKPPEGYPYFAAFARRSDDAMLWYFPDAEGRAVRVDAPAVQPGAANPGAAEAGAVDVGAGAAALRTGIALDSAHPPGSYEVFGVFSARPLGRSEIKAALGDDLTPGPELKVVRRSFSVGGNE